MDFQTQTDLLFLPILIQETIYVFDKEEQTLPKEGTIVTMPVLPFLVLYEEASPLSESLSEQLHNILKAIHIPQNKVEKLPIATFQQAMVKDREFVFIFSSYVPPPFVSLEKNKVIAINQSTKALLSDALSDLINDKQKKMALWNELKKNFQ
jgi:DNA polymerase III psi subunit